MKLTNYTVNEIEGYVTIMLYAMCNMQYAKCYLYGYVSEKCRLVKIGIRQGFKALPLKRIMFDE